MEGGQGTVAAEEFEGSRRKLSNRHWSARTPAYASGEVRVWVAVWFGDADAGCAVVALVVEAQSLVVATPAAPTWPPASCAASPATKWRSAPPAAHPADQINPTAVEATREVGIGGSDAGISAGLRAVEINPSVEPLLIVADAYPNYSICGIPYHLSGGAMASQPLCR